MNAFDVARAAVAALCVAMPGATWAAEASMTPSPKRVPDRSDAVREGVLARQPSLPLSLADAIALAMRRNTDVQIGYISRVAQKYDLLVAEDAFTPHASIVGDGGRQIASGMRTDQMTVGPHVEASTSTGAVFDFGWDAGATSMPSVRTKNSSASWSVTQPLLRGAGPDVNLAPVKSARLADDINTLHLRATISQVVTDVIIAYRALQLAEKSREIAKDAVDRAQGLVETDEVLINAGRMAAMEIVQAQADLENQKLIYLQSKGQIEAARLALTTLLNVDLETSVVLTDIMEPHQVHVVVAEALAMALKCRPDYLGQRDVVEQDRLGIVVADNQRLWDVALIGSGSLGRQVQAQAGAKRAVSALGGAAVGMRFSVPLNDLSAEQASVHASTSLSSAEIQLEVIKRAIEQQVRLLAADIDLKWQELQASRRAAALASSAVDVEKQKLNVGRSSNFQVQFLESAYRSAQSQSLNAMMDYADALTTFDLDLGTTMDTWKIALRQQ